MFAIDFHEKWKSCWIDSLPVDTENCRLKNFRFRLFRPRGVIQSEINFLVKLLAKWKQISNQFSILFIKNSLNFVRKESL